MLIPPQVRALIQMALDEDLGRGDLTAAAVPEGTLATARVIARGPTVLSGLELVAPIFAEAGVALDRLVLARKNGEQIEADSEILRLRADARGVLGVERTLLNFLQRTCGIASTAREYARRVEGLAPDFRVVDTRKTLPGWRYLDKQAVRHGGLHNHRFGLDGGILLKENHIRAAGGIRAAVGNLAASVPHGMAIECEVTSFSEAEEAIAAGVRILLLDNFSAAQLRIDVPKLRALRADLILEASGNVNLDTVADFVRTGVNIVSVGALTHSVRAANLSMLFEFAAG